MVAPRAPGRRGACIEYGSSEGQPLAPNCGGRDPQASNPTYPLVVLPCKSSIFTKTTRETYCGGCWSRSQGLGLHRDAQGVCWMRHMLTNVRIHTYQSVHSQSKVQSSIAIARGTHVLLVTFASMEASELGLTWHRSFVGTSIVMPLPPGRPGQGV